MKRQAFVLLALFAVPAAADTLLTYQRISPEFSFNGHSSGGRQTIRVLVGTDRVRLEEPRFTAILRKDERKLYILRDGQYYVIQLPVDVKAELPADLYQTTWGEANEAPLPITTETSDSPVTVGRWQATKHRVAVTTAEPGKVEGNAGKTFYSLWTTEQIGGISYSLVNELEADIASLNPSRARRDLSQVLANLPGVVVRTEIALANAPAETTEELVSVEEKSTTDADYRPAPGMKQGKFTGLYARMYRSF